MSDEKKLLVYFGYVVFANLLLVFLGRYVKISREALSIWFAILIVGITTALGPILFSAGKSDDSSDDD